MKSTDTTGRLIGSSPSIQALRAFIPKVASRNCNVLITGETGTGKELVAEAIHMTVRAPAAASCASTALHCRTPCWKASCSATRRAHSPERTPVPWPVA